MGFMNLLDKWLAFNRPRTFRRLENEKKIVRSIVHDACESMVPLIRKKIGDDSWTPNVSVSFSERRRRSYGGVKFYKKDKQYKPWMSLAGIYFLENDNVGFTEYAEFADDREIGNLPADAPREQCIWALVAHELAHCVQWSLITKVFSHSKYAHGDDDDRGHGALWKEVYRDLRVNFINGGVKMEAAVQNQTDVIKMTGVKAPKEKRVTNRSRVNAIFEANKDKKTSDIVALVMEDLKISKSYAYTYVYLARKDAGLTK